MGRNMVNQPHADIDDPRAGFGQNDGQHGDVNEVLAPGHISSADILHEPLRRSLSAGVNLR